MIVNGTHEGDWKKVLTLSQQHPIIRPSLGLHPWYAHKATPDWLTQLEHLLDTYPNTIIGEIGLDKWLHPRDDRAQQEAFSAQLHLARQRQLPATIHCLKAFGKLLDILNAEGTPPGGFLMHSYSGPEELLHDYLDLGAYLSVSPYFAQPKKQNTWKLIKQIPDDRLLLETDAPDMLGPPELAPHTQPNPTDKNAPPLNEPANLPHLAHWLAQLRNTTPETLAEQTCNNAKQLFGKLLEDF